MFIIIFLLSGRREQDGTVTGELLSDYTEISFENVKRTHEGTGTEMEIAVALCRKVSSQTFEKELTAAGFRIVDM